MTKKSPTGKTSLTTRRARRKGRDKGQRDMPPGGLKAKKRRSYSQPLEAQGLVPRRCEQQRHCEGSVPDPVKPESRCHLSKAHN
jgi:hypothetical protein